MATLKKIDLIENKITTEPLELPINMVGDTIREVDSDLIFQEDKAKQALWERPIAFKTQDGILKYWVMLDKIYVVIELVATPEDRIKFEKVLKTIDRNVSEDDFMQNLEQALVA